MLIRDAIPTDVPLIFDSWMKSWRSNPYAGCISNNIYYATVRENIEHLIARGAIIKVACLDNDEDTILGWVCYERLPDGVYCVHYIYVKDPYLKHNVGQALAKQIPESGFYSYRCSQMRDFFPTFKWAREIACRK